MRKGTEKKDKEEEEEEGEGKERSRLIKEGKKIREVDNTYSGLHRSSSDTTGSLNR